MLLHGVLLLAAGLRVSTCVATYHQYSRCTILAGSLAGSMLMCVVGDVDTLAMHTTTLLPTTTLPLLLHYYLLLRNGMLQWYGVHMV